MDVRQEEVNRLLVDPSFRNWALNTNGLDYDKWEKYLSDEKELLEIAKEAKNIIVNVETSDNEVKNDDYQSFEMLKSKLKGKDGNQFTAPGIRNKTVSFSYNTLIKVAAVISFFIVFSGILYLNYDRIEQPGQLAEENYYKQTQSGQQLTITLPDGSKVKLNSNSSISYPREFFKDRKVKLSGEAFFNVVRDEISPFIVTTDNFLTEVLGTSFNINAYEHNNAKVSVATGKVKVSSLNDLEDVSFKILEDEQALLVSDSKLKLSVFDKDEILWKDGILVFTDESIQSISLKIQRWFNVKVSIENESKIAGRFSGKYSNESLQDILKGMGYAMNLSFKMEGNEIIINGKNE